MNEHVLASGRARFAADVLDQSKAMPVLVDFWADWCGPCKMLAPVLDRIAADYAGRARVIKVDTDAEQQLAAEHGIRSLPTLRLFRHGRAVEELIGVQPESVIRALVERYLEKPSDQARAEASRLVAGGQAAEAVLILENILREEPENLEARVELVEALIAAEQLEEAGRRFDALPVQLLESPGLKAIEARLKLARALVGAADVDTLRRRVADDPADLGSRQQLAAVEFSAGRYEAALELWLEVLRRDRNFGEGAARDSLLQAFELMQGQEELVQRYRRQMMALLH